MTCRMQFKINPIDRKSLPPTYTAGIDRSKSFFNDGQIVVVGDVFLMSVSRVIGMAMRNNCVVYRSPRVEINPRLSTVNPLRSKLKQRSFHSELKLQQISIIA
jgi:hypothetical protein